MNLDKFMVSTSSVMNSTSNKERDVLTTNCHNQDDGGKEGCEGISSHHDFGYHSAASIPPSSPYSDFDEAVWYRYWCICYALEVIA